MHTHLLHDYYAMHPIYIQVNYCVLLLVLCSILAEIKGEVFYICCCSGHYQENTKQRLTSKRRYNQKESRKINDTCLSWMYVNHFNNGHVEVEYIPAHTGHTLSHSELKYLPLPGSAKEEVATKLSLGVNPSCILNSKAAYQ